MRIQEIKEKFFPPGRRVNVPTVLQMEAVECGAASLAMVLAYYGKWIPLEKLRQECGVTRDGSNAENIIKAARRLGLKASGRAGRPSILKKRDYPLILFWEFNHFVVMEGYEGDTVFLNDPAMGRRSVPWHEFLTSYTGVYIRLEPEADFQKEGQPYSITRALAEKLKGDKWAVVFVLLLGLCMIIPGLAVPVMSQIFIDEIFSMKKPDWTPYLFVAMVATMVMSGLMAAMRANVLTLAKKADACRFVWLLLACTASAGGVFSAAVCRRRGITHSV